MLSCVCGNAVEWRFLLSGVTLGAATGVPNPAPRWLTDKSWTQILNLSALPAFQVSKDNLLAKDVLPPLLHLPKSFHSAVRDSHTHQWQCLAYVCFHVLCDSITCLPDQEQFALATSPVRSHHIEQGERCLSGVCLQGFSANFAEQSGAFQAIFDSNEAQEAPLPEPWKTCLTSFQKLAVLRCLRPDKVWTVGLALIIAVTPYN